LRIITAVVGRDAMKLSVNIASQNRVMFIKDFGTDEEWRAKLEAQQAKLIESAGNG